MSWHHSTRLPAAPLLSFAAAAAVFLMPSLDAQQPIPPGLCRIDGKATSGGVPIPGVSVVVRDGEALVGATSTDTDGTYRMTVKAATLRVVAELSGFVAISRDVTPAADPCSQTIDFALVLLGPLDRPPRPSQRGAEVRRPVNDSKRCRSSNNQPARSQPTPRQTVMVKMPRVNCCRPVSRPRQRRKR